MYPAECRPIDSTTVCLLSARPGRHKTLGPKHLSIAIHDELTPDEARFLRSYSPMLMLSLSYIVVTANSRILAFSLEDGSLVQSLQGHRMCMLSLATHQDTLVSSSVDGSVRIWDIVTGQCTRMITPGRVTGLRIVRPRPQNCEHLSIMKEGNANLLIVVMCAENNLKVWTVPNYLGAQLSEDMAAVSVCTTLLDGALTTPIFRGRWVS